MASRHKLTSKPRRSQNDKAELRKFLVIVAIATLALIALVYVLIK
ncbi:MAG: hypothetical protein ABMA02_08590 [Saprospiraceae bacterium]